MSNISHFQVSNKATHSVSEIISIKLLAETCLSLCISTKILPFVEETKGIKN